jgi:hypothetical protein
MPAKRHTRSTASGPRLDVGAFEPVMRLYLDHMNEKERRRFEVFERAWEALGARSEDPSMRVALAVAYLGSGK